MRLSFIHDNDMNKKPVAKRLLLHTAPGFNFKYRKINIGHQDLFVKKMASGQGSHWLIESPTIFHLIFPLCVTHPSEIFVNFVFKHIHPGSIYVTCR